MEDLADDGLCPRAVPLDAAHAAVGVDRRAAPHRVRKVGERCALLRIDGTAHPAVAGPQAFADVALDGVDRPAHLLAAVVEGAVVRIDVVEIDFADAEPLLHLLEVRPQRRRRQLRSFLFAPEREHVVGSAEARRPVHHRPAADGTALQDRDGEIGGRAIAAVLIQPRIRGRLLHVELGLGVVAAFLEDDDLRARFRQTRSHDRSTGPASHHAEVGREDEIPADLVAADNPAHGRLRDAFTVRTSSYGGPG